MNPRDTNLHTTATRLLRMPTVEERVGLKKTGIYDRINPKHKKYDPTFPKPIKLGSASVWPEHEVEEWIAKQIEQQRRAA